MISALQATYGWPAGLIAAVRAVKNVEAFFSQHALCGIPCDWPLRFVALGAAYRGLRPHCGPRWAASVCVGVLLAKEVFDCFAVLDPWHPRPPDWGDAADVLTGLAGIAAGMIVSRRRKCGSAM
jgi:hypothetical protein